jgi:VIT1/CCC1 family predicted Fe2+/Mn2+ transporter
MKTMEDNIVTNSIMEKYLSDFVYGGVDGIITTFAIVSGIAGAKLSYKLIIILGLANVLADGFSMATGRYLSAEAESEILEKENRKRELSPFVSSLITFLAFVGLGMIPIISFIIGHFFSNGDKMFNITYIFTGLSLFFVGYIRGKVLEDNPIYSGVETLTIGGLASIISFIVGRLLSSIN